MILERIDITECRIPDTRRRMTVMQQRSHVITALAHLRKPFLCNRPQLDGTIGKPGVDSRISPHRSGDPKDVIPTAQPAEVQRNAPGFTFVHKATVHAAQVFARWGAAVFSA